VLAAAGANDWGQVMTQSQKRFSIVLLVVGAIVALLFVWAASQFHWVEEEIDHGFSKAANQNQFLAAKLFLQKQGIPVSVVKNQQLLDKGSWRNIELKPEDTIILVNAYKTLDEDRYYRLKDWIESGGTLIASTQNPFVGSHTKENDLLLDDFSIEQAPAEIEEKGDFLEELTKDLKKKEKELQEEKDNKQKQKDKESQINTEKQSGKEKQTSKENEKDKEQSDKEVNKSKSSEELAREKKQTEVKKNYLARCGKSKDAIKVEFASEEKPLAFDFSREQAFIYYDYEGVSDEDEPKERSEHLLYFDWGEGGVTFLSDTFIWSNRRIDCHDHAYALWSLINLDGRVWILINQDAPSLSSIIWHKAPYGLIACILALILWLWLKSQTLGPVFVQKTLERRSLSEHLYATGILLWRQFHSPQLLVVLRKEILELLEKRHSLANVPENDPSAQTRLDFLHELTGLSREAIKHALFADAVHEPQDLARVIANLQIIRKKI
jgi:hypothetical protein